MPAPMPFDAPVTTATLPCNLPMFVISLECLRTGVSRRVAVIEGYRASGGPLRGPGNFSGVHEVDPSARQAMMPPCQIPPSAEE